MNGWSWLLLIVILLVLVLLVWWWRRRSTTVVPPVSTTATRSGPAVMPMAASTPTAATTMPVTPAPAVPTMAAPVDDLVIIEGIGPKIAAILKAAGIATFGQLAATDTMKLQGILREAGMPFADPGTWAEQAALAAAGKSQELKALQDSLKGGRRV